MRDHKTFMVSCENCSLVWKVIRFPRRCPKCGHSPVRHATDEELIEEMGII